MSLIYYQH